MAVAVLSPCADRNAVVWSRLSRPTTELGETGSGSDSLGLDGGARNVILESCRRCFSTLGEWPWDSDITTAVLPSCRDMLS